MMPLLGDVFPAPGEHATRVAPTTEVQPMWALRSVLILLIVLLPAGPFATTFL